MARSVSEGMHIFVVCESKVTGRENVTQLNCQGRSQVLSSVKCQNDIIGCRYERQHRALQGRERLLLSGRCSLGVEGYQLSVVRETVLLITCINQDHDGLAHKVFLMLYWKQNPKKFGTFLCRQAEHNWFYFSTLWNNVLKGCEKFSCVAPERFPLILWQLTWLSCFLSVARTQSNTKSKFK